MANIGNEVMESRVASITVDRPEAGETLTVAVTPGLHVVLAFNPAAAKFAVAGEDFVLTLADGGQVVFAGLVSAAQGGDAPTLHVAGIDFDAGVLMERVLALAEEAEAEPIETAAGEDGEGEEGEAEDGGGSHYDDSFGDLIAGLIKQGVIGETELGFGLIGSGGTEFLVEAEFLSEGYLLNDGEFFGGGFGLPSATPLAGVAPDAPAGPVTVLGAPPISVSVSDDSSDTSEFSVGAVSDADAAANSVSESAANGTVVGITALASDGDGTDTVSYSLSDDAGGRFAIDAGSGVITVADTSLLDYETATSHSVTVLATSTDGSTSSQAFTVNLSDIDDAPVAADDSATTNEDTALIISAAGLLANDSDLDGDSLSITGFTQSANGSVVDNGDGTFTYTPNAGFNGTDSFTYTVSDGQGGTDTASVTVTVNPVPDVLIVGSNDHDDTALNPSGLEHRVNPVEGTRGDILGGAGDDVLIGDPGGVSAGDLNIAITIDASSSMVINYVSTGVTRWDVVMDAVEKLLNQLAGHTGTVNLYVQTFGTEANATVFSGVFTAGDLAQLVIDINNEIPTDQDIPYEYTNYEAPLADTQTWFEGQDNDFTNVGFFLSDGEPNRWLDNDGIVQGSGGSFSQTALDEALAAASDMIDQTGLLSGGDQVLLNAIGMGGATLSTLNQIDNTDGAQIVDLGDPSALQEALLSALSDVGADVINGGAGDDVIFGDVPNTDQLAIDQGVSLLPGSGWLVFQELEGGDFPLWDRDDTIAYLRNNVAELSAGGRGDADIIDGGAGDDMLIGGGGADSLDGGTGTDTASYSGSGAGVTVDLAAGTGSGGDAQGDTLVGVENLTGSGFDDTLTGDGGANTLDGGAGADTLDGGAGNDILIWDSADTTINGGTGTDTLRVASGSLLDVDLTTFAGTIAGIEVIDLETDAGANAITLTASDVLNMSDTDILTIDGDTGDSIDAGTGWTDGGVSGGYHVYTQGLATLNVDTDMTVNVDIAS